MSNNQLAIKEYLKPMYETLNSLEVIKQNLRKYIAEAEHEKI